MAIILNYKIILFAPWYVFCALRSSVMRNASHFWFILIFNVFVFFQWIYIFFFLGMGWVGVIGSNLGILGFLVSNIYLQLSPSQYHGKSRLFLCSYVTRLLVGTGSIVYMYIFSIFSKNIIYNFKHASISDYYFDNTIFNVIGAFNLVLIILWIIFVISIDIDLFESFPRGKEVIFPVRIKLIQKIYLLVFYIIGFVIFFDILGVCHA